MNRKKVVSLLLTLGILATPLVVPQYATGNLNNKVYAYDGTIQNGNKVQKEPLQTDTGLVGDSIVAEDKLSESSTYDELMASPYKVEMPDSFLTKESNGQVAGIEMEKLNVDGKIYHYQFSFGTTLCNRFIEVRKMYVGEQGAIIRVYSMVSFLDSDHKFNQYSIGSSATSDYNLYPYLVKYTTNNVDLMNPKPFIDRNIHINNDGKYVDVDGKVVKPDSNGYYEAYSDRIHSAVNTVHIGTTNEDSGFVHYGTITGDEPTNFSNSTYDPSKYDEFGHLKSGSGDTPTTPTNPTNPNFKRIDVTRIAGQDRKETATNIASSFINETKPKTIIVAYGYNYADALAGAPLARQLNAPIVLVGAYQDSGNVLKYVKSALANNGNIVLLGGTGVVPDSFKEWFIANGVDASHITRYGGADRFETASKIVNAVTASSTAPIFIASGENFPDALSASSVAAARGYRIFLTTANNESAYLSNYLSKNKPSKVYLLGGSGVISTEQESAIATQLGNKDSVKRLGGAIRYETSQAIANEFKDGVTNAIIVNGEDYPDAISGSVLAMRTPSITLLTPSDNLSGIKNFLADNDTITSGLLLGGTGVLPDSVKTSLSK